MPEPQEPAPMPDTESPEVLAAKRRQMAEMMSRGGRESTILTSPSDRGGIGDYNKTKLGA